MWLLGLAILLAALPFGEAFRFPAAFRNRKAVKLSTLSDAPVPEGGLSDLEIEFDELLKEVREALESEGGRDPTHPSAQAQLEELKKSESEGNFAGLSNSLGKFRNSAKQGLQLFQDGDLGGALREFDTALSFNSSQPLAQRGITLYCLGQYEDAAAQLKQDVERIEGSKLYKASDLRLWLSACFNHLGNAKASKNALDLDSYSSEANAVADTNRLMENLLLFFGKEKGLDDLLEEIGSVDTGKSEVHGPLFYGNFYLGLFYESTGEMELAKAFLEIPANSGKYSKNDMWYHVPRYILNRLP